MHTDGQSSGELTVEDSTRHTGVDEDQDQDRHRIRDAEHDYRVYTTALLCPGLPTVIVGLVVPLHGYGLAVEECDHGQAKAKHPHQQDGDQWEVLPPIVLVERVNDSIVPAKM